MRTFVIATVAVMVWDAIADGISCIAFAMWGMWVLGEAA